MPLILAIEPDHRQAAQIASIARDRVDAELVLAHTTEGALDVIGDRVPDLVLVPALLSPQDDAALAAALRVIAAAAHVRTLTIPVFATAAPAPATRGVLGRWRRPKEAPAPDGCDPAVFAEQICAYLEERAACADMLPPSVQPAKPVQQIEIAARQIEVAPPVAVTPPVAVAPPAGDMPIANDEPRAEEAALGPSTALRAGDEVTTVEIDLSLELDSANRSTALEAGDEEAAAVGEPVYDLVIDEEPIAIDEPDIPSLRPPRPFEPWVPMSCGVERLWPPIEGMLVEEDRPERTEWTALIASLRQDMERRRDTPDPEPVARRTNRRLATPVQDEWGFFDPEQCGFAALLAKLDEITGSQNV